jgi:hypothetical protein
MTARPEARRLLTIPHALRRATRPALREVLERVTGLA